MKFLLVAATQNEVQPIISQFELIEEQELFCCDKFDLLITGVGMVATAFMLGKHLAGRKYRFAINAGVAGSFNHKINLGEVVNVTKDCFCELGAEDGDLFIPLEELGLGESKIKPIESGIKHDLPTVKGITVNTIHGNEKSIEVLRTRLNPGVESMEGAAFFYACNHHNLPSIQIRAISNYVEKRNRGNWKISLAIDNLNNKVIELISTFQ
jgi:futalosine hydrolase